MINIKSLFAILLISSPLAYASEPPVLLLDEGSTRVALTLNNRSDSDISSVSVSVDQSKLPSWLSVQCEPRAVQVPLGAKSQDKLFRFFSELVGKEIYLYRLH